MAGFPFPEQSRCKTLIKDKRHNHTDGPNSNSSDWGRWGGGRGKSKDGRRKSGQEERKKRRKCPARRNGDETYAQTVICMFSHPLQDFLSHGVPASILKLLSLLPPQAFRWDLQLEASEKTRRPGAAGGPTLLSSPDPRAGPPPEQGVAPPQDADSQRHTDRLPISSLDQASRQNLKADRKAEGTAHCRGS